MIREKNRVTTATAANDECHESVSIELGRNWMVCRSFVRSIGMLYQYCGPEEEEKKTNGKSMQICNNQW